MKRFTLEWLPAKDIELLPQWHSTALDMHYLLVAFKEYKTVRIGWYFGGLIKQWRVDDSPSMHEAEYWAPLPEKP